MRAQNILVREPSPLLLYRSHTHTRPNTNQTWSRDGEVLSERNRATFLPTPPLFLSLSFSETHIRNALPRYPTHKHTQTLSAQQAHALSSSKLPQSESSTKVDIDICVI